MKNTMLVTPYTPEALRVLKIAALYLDKITIPRPRLYEVTPETPGKLGRGAIGVITGITEFVDESFLRDIELLIQENLVELVDEDQLDKPVQDGKRLETVFSQNLSLLIEESEIRRDEQGREISVRFVDEEVKTVHEKHVGAIRIGGRIDLGFLYQYYSLLFSLAGNAVSSGISVLSGSEPLRSLISHAYSSGVLDSPRLKRLFPDLVEPQIIADLVEAALLDVSNLPFEDILEARRELSDELLAFRATMASLHFELSREFGADKLLEEGRKISRMRLRPQLSDLERKIAAAERGVLKDLLSAAQKPDAYIPLLGAGFLGLPPSLALLISAGIISIEAVLEWKKREDELHGNGLFYLVALRRKLGGCS